MGLRWLCNYCRTNKFRKVEISVVTDAENSQFSSFFTAFRYLLKSLHASDKSWRRQRCVKSLPKERSSLFEVVSWGDWWLLDIMRHVAFEVIPARCILENGVRLCWTQALRILLRLEPFIRSRSRHLSPAKLVFDVVKARLCCIEAWLAQVV